MLPQQHNKELGLLWRENPVNLPSSACLRWTTYPSLTRCLPHVTQLCELCEPP